MTSTFAIVTGSSGQLGKLITSTLKAEGWFVFGIDSQREPYQTDDSPDFFIQTDITSANDVDDAFEAISEMVNDFHDAPTHISLINNAGVAVFTPSEDRTLEEFDMVCRVNMYAPIIMTTRFLKLKKTILASTGSVVNIGSIYGHISPNSSIYTDTSRQSSDVYGASKAGLSQLTRYFAVRYANEMVRVNCVSPGGVLNNDLQGPDFIKRYSALVPTQKLLLPTDVAKIVLDLSNNSPMQLTGQTILLDGGYSSW